MISLLLVYVCTHLTFDERLSLLHALNLSPIFLVKYRLWKEDISLIPWMKHRSYAEAKSAYDRFHTGRPGRVKCDDQGKIWHRGKIIREGARCKEIVTYRQVREYVTCGWAEKEWRILYLTFDDVLRSINWAHTEIKNVEAIMEMRRGIIVRTKDNHFYCTDGRFRNFNSPFGRMLYLGQIQDKGEMGYRIRHDDKDRFIGVYFGEIKYVAHVHSRDGYIHGLTESCTKLSCW